MALISAGLIEGATDAMGAGMAGAAAGGAGAAAGGVSSGLLGGIISGGVGALGDILGFGGQQNTNATNLAIAQANNQFNAQQAQLNRNFQAQQTQQVEGYDTLMSDTAMQRRVEDLKAANLNPGLAYSMGGASAPMVSAPSGSSAQASGNPIMQNPDAAFTQLGNQASNAVQASTVASEIQKNQAQSTALLASAKKDASSTYDDGQFSRQINAQIQGVTSSAAQANQNVVNLQEQIKEIDANVKRIESQTTGQNISNDWMPLINKLATQLSGVQLQLNQLAIPKAQLESGVAGTANSVLQQAGGITDSIGSYLGNKAADVHDWIGDTASKLENWWSQAVKNAQSPRGY